jgi:hypothetical protein
MSSSEQQLETVEGRKSCANNNQPCTKATPSCFAAPKSMGEPEQQQHVLTTLSKKTNYASYQRGRSEFPDRSSDAHAGQKRGSQRGISALCRQIQLVALFDYFDFLNKDRRCV